MKCWLLFSLAIIILPSLCESCGEPGLGLSIEVSVNPPVPVVGERAELRCRVSDSSLSDWTDVVVSSGSTLAWSEGGLTDWSLYQGREQVHDSAARETILRISNFTARDYGLYTCRCINDFSYIQYEVCGGRDGLATHCSAATELELVPSGQETTIHTQSVDTPGTVVSLSPCTGGWDHIDYRGSLKEDTGKELTVNTPQDQAKFVCVSSVNSSPDQIVYVTIQDYYPLRILYPTSDTADVVFNNGSGPTPICATFSSFPHSTNTSLSLHLDNTVETLVASTNKYVVTLNEGQCKWVRAYLVDEVVLNVTKEYSSVLFSCSVSSPWETLTRNFTVHKNRTAVSQVCSTAHTVSSNGPIPSLTSSPVLTSEPNLVVAAFQSATPSLPPPTDDGGNNGSSIAIIVGAGVIVVVILIVAGAIFVAVCLWRRRKRARTEMYKLPDNDNSFATEPDPMFPAQPSLIDSHSNSHSHQLPNGHSVHQLTHNGVPVSRQMAKCISGLQQSPWLFPYEKLEFHEELGSGAFGVVKRALAHSLQPGEPTTVVAVKMLKESTSSYDEEKDLISELKVLQHVGAHPNIVCLLGAAVNNGMLYVIVEYCCNGNLLRYLRSKRNDQLSPLTVRHCVDMAAQVATGMEFLASKDCIHRDLAARNVLITEDNVLKVADFGLARKMYESVYRPSGGKVPVKWLAPESIINHAYTTQSDVWSFGIVLWEILTLGRTPYPAKSAEEMLRDLEDGYRMPRPPSCPTQIYDVMVKCWQWRSEERPTFGELVGQLEEILTADEPALNRHYYNMDISGQENNGDSTIDSTLCSREDLDSSCDGPIHTCHSCGNNFTTTCTLSSDPTKIFCDDCSQMPEYLSRSSLDLLSTCDEGTVGRRAGRRWTQRLHSNDSGVKVSLEEASSDFYQLTSGVRAAAFAKILAESLQSMCSECKTEVDELAFGSVWGESSDSLSSLCNGCRESLEGHKYTNILSPTIEELSREREEYMRQRMDKLLALSEESPRPKSVDASLLLSRQDEEVREEEREDGKSDDLSRENSKVELRQKFSNDSGIKSLSEPPVHLKRASAPPLNGRLNGACFSPQTPHLSMQTSGCSTPSSRLSAHPRNRELFEQLGIQETDI